MKVVQFGIYEALVALSGVASAMSTFKGLPAIFTDDEVPGKAQFPYTHIRPAMLNEPWDTKNVTFGRLVAIDVAVYQANTGDSSLCDDVAEIIRNRLHRQAVTISGYGTLIAQASGPVQAPTDDQVYGRIVTATVTIIKA